VQRIVKELADTIGLADAIALVRRWGGRRLYCPVQVGPGDPLALTMGLESARRLVAAFGGQSLQLPAERNALLDLRNAAIVAAAAGGQSHEKIGITYGLTRQAVSHILRVHRGRGGDSAQTFAGVHAGGTAAQSRANT
jgi:Mor family transcriptional regulator